MLDQARLNSLPQRLGEFESHQVALECPDMLAKAGYVAVGMGGVDAAQTASTPEGFRGKSPGVVGFRKPGPTVPDLLPGVSLTVLGWAIA